MKKKEALSIPKRVELLARLEAGESLVLLAKEFNRHRETIRMIRNRVMKEGTDWYLKPGKRGPKRGGDSPRTGRKAHRLITNTEKGVIREELEKRYGRGGVEEGDVGWRIDRVTEAIRKELGFTPLRKYVIVLMEEWGVKPLRKATSLVYNRGLSAAGSGADILRREHERRKAVNARIASGGRDELKLLGTPRGSRAGPGMMWRRRESDDSEVCYFLIEVWTAGPDCLFDEWGKGVCRRELMKLGRNFDIDLLTYVIMDSHCFMILRLPAREKWMRKFYEGSDSENEEETLSHAYRCFGKDQKFKIQRELELLDGQERAVYLEDLRASFCNLSQTIKLFKEAVTAVINEQEGKAGSFWGERFGSMRLRTSEERLNAGIRIDGWAGRQGLLVDEKPEAYPWCGFAEVADGSKRFIKGFCRLVGIPVGGLERNPKMVGLGEAGKPIERYRERLMKDRRM